jgi:hypothetical protein
MAGMLDSRIQWRVLEPVVLVDPVEIRASYFLAMLYLIEITLLSLAAQSLCIAVAAMVAKPQIVMNLATKASEVTARVAMAARVETKR